MWSDIRHLIGAVTGRPEIWTLVGVAVGWCLNELSTIIKARRDDRRLIGKALEVLLEIRYRVVGLQFTLDYLRKLGMPAELEMHLRQSLDELFPPPAKLYDHYNDCLNALAGPYPTLAFRLRSKDLLSPMLQKMRGLVAANAPDNPAAAAWFSGFEAGTVEAVVPGLNDALLTLSRKHGLLTWWRVWQHLRKKVQMPAEFDKLIQTHLPNAPGQTSPGRK